jgi:hypothetical protein
LCTLYSVCVHAFCYALLSTVVDLLPSMLLLFLWLQKLQTLSIIYSFQVI